MANVIISCIEGSALRYPGAIPMAAGDSATVSTLAPSTKEAPSAKARASSINDAPAVGADGSKEGLVSITAEGGPITVREYLPASPFTGSGDDGYEDHVLQDGETAEAMTIQENVKTLVVMDAG